MFQKTMPGLLGIALLTFLSGCNSLQDQCNTVWLSSKSHCQAHRCWRDMKDCYSEVCYPVDFRRGFIQGYEDVAAGGNGCPPLLPPRHYWKPCYMNPKGHCKTIEWFNGYAHGALAANQCGADGYSTIPISPQFNGGIPPGAEHHIQGPCPDPSSAADYQSLDAPGVDVNEAMPTNSQILIPETPKKPYE